MQDTNNTPTIDSQEIERFNRLAKMWWNPEGPMWPLHLMNQFRIRLILDVLAEQDKIVRNQDWPLTGLKVLDIGCGGGILSETLAQLGAEVTGIDLAEGNVKIAQEHAKATGLTIDYRLQDVTTLSEHFDLIFNMEVVEHVGDLPLFMEFCYRCLKPGGITFVSTINKTLLSYFFAIVGAEFILKLLPRGTHQWKKFVSPETLEGMLRSSQVTPFWYSGIRFNPFSRQFGVQRSMAVSYMLAGQKTV